jgi:hypothetical protein
MKKHKFPFLFLNKLGTPSVTFLKLFLNHSFGIYIYIYNWNFKIYMAWVIFWYKIWNEKHSLSEFYVILKLGGSQNFGHDISSATTQGHVFLCKYR